MLIYKVTMGDSEGIWEFKNRFPAKNISEALSKAQRHAEDLVRRMRADEVKDKTPKKERLPKSFKLTVDSVELLFETD